MTYSKHTLEDKVDSLKKEVNLKWQNQLIRALVELRSETVDYDAGRVIKELYKICLDLLKQIYRDLNVKKLPPNITIKTLAEYLDKNTHVLSYESLQNLINLGRDRNIVEHPKSDVKFNANIAEDHFNNCLTILEWYYCVFNQGPKLKHGIYKFQDKSSLLSSLQKGALRISQATIADFKGVLNKGKYLDKKFILPSKWNAILQAFLDQEKTSAIIISAPAGAGKSCFLCKKAEDLRNAGKIVLFWHSGNLPYPNYDNFILALADNEEKRIKNISDFTELISSSGCSKSKMVILIDGLNEHGNYVNAFRRILAFHKRITEQNISCVKLIFSIREKADYLIRQDIDDAKPLFYSPDGKAVIVSLPQYTDSEICNIYENYTDFSSFGPEYGKISKHLKKLFKIPLMIRLYTEAIRYNEIKCFNVIRNDLWELYNQRAGFDLVSQNADIIKLTMRQLIVAAAEKKFSNPSIDISLDQFITVESKKRTNVEESYLQLCKEGYFIDYKNKSFNFYYEDFLEYILSKYVFLRYDDGEVEQLCRILEETSKEHIWLTNAFGEFLYDKFTNEQTNFEIIRDTLRTVLHETRDVCARAMVYLYFLLETSENKKCTEIANLMLEILVSPGEDEIKKKVFQLISSESLDELETERIRQVCDSYLKFQKDRKDAFGIADALVWMSDLYFYNRKDDYRNAIQGINKAIHILEKIDDSKLMLNKARLFLAHVYSDAGNRISAWQLIEKCLYFFKKHEDDNIDYKRGYAVSLYYRYMLKGDASGNFVKKVVNNLDMAKQKFDEIGDKSSLARCLINRAIVDLYFEQNIHPMGKQDCALYTCNQAIMLCEEIGDIQGKAYALINRASFAIQKACFLNTEGNFGKMDEYFIGALHDLIEVINIFEVTEERYLVVLTYANLASISQIINIKLAIYLINKVIRYNSDNGRQKNDYAKENYIDFYNQFDAIITKAYYNRDVVLIRDNLINIAREKGYQQGILRAYWYLWDLSENNEKEKYKEQALKISCELGWGIDPRQLLYSPWYAGIFLRQNLRFQINCKEVREANTQFNECGNESFLDISNIFHGESVNDSKKLELDEVLPFEIINQFHNDLSRVRHNWEEQKLSCLNLDVPIGINTHTLDIGYTGNSTKIDTLTWLWRSGQIAKNFEEWLIQAQSEENRSHALESIEGGKLGKWLNVLDKSAYDRYLKEKIAIWESISGKMDAKKVRNIGREQGEVKFFNEVKGWGMIERKSGGDIFVHYTDIISDSDYKALYDGQPVEFEVGKDVKGRLKALNVFWKK